MIYITSDNNDARFALGNLGSRNLITFGVNPSTATDTEPDATIRRIRAYGEHHGFDGWMMFNLYPQRATDPSDLHVLREPDLHRENIEVIGKILRSTEDCTLCAAWGGLIEKRDFLPSCLREILSAIGTSEWHSIGQPTKRGHPRHPLYVRRLSPLEPFAVREYLARL